MAAAPKADSSRSSVSMPSGGGGGLMGEMSAILARRSVEKNTLSVYTEHRNLSQFKRVSYQKHEAQLGSRVP